MKCNLRVFAAVVTLSLASCGSGSSDAQRDTADFFTKLSQGYRMQVRSELPADAMWKEVDIESVRDLDEIDWAKDVAELTGYIMRHKGIMDGPLFLLFKIQGGEFEGNAMLCQPVENPVAESGSIHAISEQARKLVRTTHRGKRSNLDTAFRALESFARQEGLRPTGWGAIRILRGALVESKLSQFLTEAILYVE